MKRKAPFGLFMRKKDATEKEPKSAKRRGLSDRQILKEVARILNVREEDIPKTLERFMKEIEDMEKSVKGPAL